MQIEMRVLAGDTVTFEDMRKAGWQIGGVSDHRAYTTGYHVRSPQGEELVAYTDGERVVHISR